MRDIVNNADHLFYYDTTKSLQLYAQNQWHDVEVLKKEEIELPGTGRQFAFLFKPINGPYLRLPGTGSTATSAADAFAGITANDPAMQKIIATAKKASRMATTVLIEGESGTGKEMIAQGIHLASGRKGPFIVINCGSIPRELLQSELFGYVDGAFTGAKKGGKTGKFMQADGSTIFLDEIGKMPEDMQVSLLRFLQDKMINPLGDNRTYKVDVRIVAATNHDLMEEVCKGKFRQDLYYRLNVVNLKLPPLRKRKDDMPTLAKNILKQICMDYDIPTKPFSKKCMQHLSQYNWPGNVRDLRNLVERALVVSNGEEICTEDFFGEVIHLKKQPNAYEKTAIINLLDKYDGNISATAKAMGVARTTLYRRMKNLNIEVLTK